MTLTPKGFLTDHPTLRSEEEVRNATKAAYSTLAGLAQCAPQRSKYTFFYSHDEDDHDWFECEASSPREAWALAEAHVGGGMASRTLWLREVQPIPTPRSGSAGR